MKKYFLLLLLLIPFNVYAEVATNISKESKYILNSSETSKLSDDNVKTNVTINPDNSLKITSNQNISHIYIIYEISSKNGTLTTENEEISLGADGFLHEYQKLTIPVKELTITYDEAAKISEIQIYSEGDVPSDVQIWKKETKTDLMIFSTHADDEQLFFAGVMPTYINQGKKVHVVYLARHDVGAYYAPNRLHEQLNGLWTLGVTDYPTFGLIPDAYSESLEAAESQMKSAGFTDDDVIRFDVREIRKYNPKIILGHDEEGEYGHGQHRLNTFTLKTAIEKAQDETYEVDGLEPVKIFKVYLHLYDKDNQTVLNYDTPLEKYNGRTAYEVSKEGYSKHLSQQYTWFTSWLNGKNNSYTSATQITKYNPAQWGLYYTSVGADINKNDLFENIPEDKEEVKPDNKKKTKKISIHEVYKYRKYFDDFRKNMNIYFGGLAIISLSFIVLIKMSKKKRKKATK